jgi:hypothetical protein
LRWNVRRAGRPLLRQSLDLTDAALRSWPGMLHGKRVILTELAVHPGIQARTVVYSPTAVTQRLADDASLTTVLADDAAAATRVLEARRWPLPSQLRRHPGPQPLPAS